MADITRKKRRSVLGQNTDFNPGVEKIVDVVSSYLVIYLRHLLKRIDSKCEVIIKLEVGNVKIRRKCLCRCMC